MANDTVTVNETIYVNASTEIVWDFTQDNEKRTTWDKSIIRATVLQVKPTRIVEIEAKGNLATKFQYKLYQRKKVLGECRERMTIFSLWYFWWVHKALRTNWSPILEIGQKHKLINTGPYKRIRHPMYTQVWLWAISQMLIISNWVAGLAGILLWTFMYFMRVGKEERMMLDEFGAEYEEYMKETGRILPPL